MNAVTITTHLGHSHLRRDGSQTRTDHGASKYRAEVRNHVAGHLPSYTELMESASPAECNGGELFIYPAFILYHVSNEAFALVDIREARLDYSVMSFIEEESVPGDAEVIGQTWKKANKGDNIVD